MNKVFVTMTALTALLAPFALAAHCTEPNLTRDSQEVTISDPETGAVIYYIDNDPCQTEGCIWSFWIYEETNGFENLQRQDASESDADKFTQDDTCHGAILPDTIIL